MDLALVENLRMRCLFGRDGKVELVCCLRLLIHYLAQPWFPTWYNSR